jgi:pre-mRNA-processing factor 19
VSKNGDVYEKSVLETYLKETGKDPMTGEPLSMDDVIELRTRETSVAPRPATFNSIPSLLAAFQTEWDALMLETFSLKQQLVKTRRELSTALYRNDAAVRVAARLTQERDEARTELAKLAESLGTRPSTDHHHNMDLDTPPLLAQEYVDRISNKREELFTARKANKSRAVRSIEEIASVKESHRTKQLFSSVSHLAVDESGSLIVTGGGKSQAGIFSIVDNKLSASFTTAGIVTDCLWWDATKVIVATKTGTIHGFGVDGTEIFSLDVEEKSPVIKLALHPIGDLLAAISDGKWYLIDVNAQKIVTSIDTGADHTDCIAVHPDGGLVAVGVNPGNVYVYDLMNLSVEPAGKFSVENGQAVSSLSFSENGYWLASCCEAVEREAQIWDLRKMIQSHMVEFSRNISNLEFDRSGQFLAAALGHGVEIAAYVKQDKKWQSNVFSADVPAVDVSWSAGGLLAVVSAKGNIRAFDVPLS